MVETRIGLNENKFIECVVFGETSAWADSAVLPVLAATPVEGCYIACGSANVIRGDIMD